MNLILWFMFIACSNYCFYLCKRKERLYRERKTKGNRKNDEGTNIANHEKGKHDSTSVSQSY